VRALSRECKKGVEYIAHENHIHSRVYGSIWIMLEQKKSGNGNVRGVQVHIQSESFCQNRGGVGENNI
jgi:hypothetical protein